MSASIPILAQLKPHGRHVMALKAVEHNIQEPDQHLGHRPLWGDEGKLARLSKDDANRQRATIRKYVGQLRRIASLHRQGAHDEVKEVVEEVLNSHAAKASALIRLAYKDRRSIRYADIIERAAKINLYAACNDPVAMILKDKDGGSFRTTLKFGWRHKARQMLLRDVLYAAGVGNEYDHNFRGLGPQRAIARIVEAIEMGYHYWIIFDIKDCFASVKLEHLHGMVPLMSVVR